MTGDQQHPIPVTAAKTTWDDQIVIVICPECGRAQSRRSPEPFPCVCGTWMRPKVSE